jgi:hypothetical protein
MHDLDGVLKHHGVKGQKWGVIRDRNRPGGADGKWESEKQVDNRGKLQKRLDSMKRERQWNSVLREMDKMSTKDINTVTTRVRLENDLKRLSKSKVATKKDKEDYLRRDKMSNQELSRKVARLNAKEGLLKQVSSASKEQREFGIKVVQTAGTLGVQYAKNRTLGPKDFLNAYKNPTIRTKQKAFDEAVDLLDPKVTNPRARRAFDLAKEFKSKDKPKS